jgi:hypothetical protein
MGTFPKVPPLGGFVDQSDLFEPGEKPELFGDVAVNRLALEPGRPILP